MKHTLIIALALCGLLVGCKSKETTPPIAAEASSAPTATGTVTGPNGVALPANSIAAQDFRDGKK